jgi:phenylacetate-CoA ligase/benzoylacetate-CoA ligase
MVYALTRHDVEVFTDAIAHTWFTAGVRPGDVVAHLVGLPMVAGGLSYADGFRRVGAALVWLGGFPTERILREMRRLRCTTLLATTSFGLHLAGQWSAVGEETGIPSRLSKVLCGGEPGLGQPEIRSRITRALGITHLRETMGLGDVISGMWAECDVQDGMHFNAQRYVAIELIDPASGAALPWREGATGEIVYSAFARQASPVLRYRSRDHAVVVGMSCSCGRTSPRIRCIGRTDDMLIYKGMNVFPGALRDVIATRFAGSVEPLLRVWKERKDQVRFDDPIAVDVEADPRFDLSGAQTLRQAIEDEVRTQLQVRIRVTVLAHGSLPRSAYKNALIAVRDGA